jgi:hypothetical protein
VVALYRGAHPRVSGHRLLSTTLLSIVTAAALAGCSLLVDTSDLSTDTGANGTQHPPSFGTATPFATGQTGVFALQADDAAVYWMTRSADDSGAVASMTRAGVGPSVLASMQAYPRAFTSDASRLYWAVGNGSGGSTAIASVAKMGGGAPVRFAASGHGHAEVATMAARGTQLAWAALTENGGAARVTNTSTSVTTELASRQGVIAAVAIAPPAVYWSTASAILMAGPGVAADGGAAPVMVAPGAATSMVVADDILYWASDDGTVHARASGAAPTVLASGLSSPGGLATDASYVYCACGGSGTVVAVPRAGGTSVVVAHGTEPVAVAVTSDAVYFADRAAATIVRVPKQ